MKEIYKNPVLYYILLPVVAGLWPLLLWAKYLPNAEHRWEQEQAQYNKAQEIITEILALDPDRLDFAGSDEDRAEFDYANAVDKIANLFNVTYKISSKPIRISGGQKTESAMVVLEDVDITKFAKFISTIQLRWASLQCEKLTLIKKKGLPDTWEVDIDFKYYY